MPLYTKRISNKHEYIFLYTLYKSTQTKYNLIITASEKHHTHTFIFNPLYSGIAYFVITINSNDQATALANKVNTISVWLIIVDVCVCILFTTKTNKRKLSLVRCFKNNANHNGDDVRPRRQHSSTHKNTHTSGARVRHILWTLQDAGSTIAQMQRLPKYKILFNFYKRV